MILAGAPNFRDLAGQPAYRGLHGRRLRQGRVYRSDHLGQLQPADLQRLQETLGVGVRVVDLRGVQERASAPCAIPGARVLSVPIEPTIVQKLTDLLAAGHELTTGETVALMQDTYRGFVRGNTLRFAELFSHVLEGDPSPIVFHCTAGKDRTGFAAALLLRALGVPHDVVLEDYLLTNERLQARAHTTAVPPQVAHVLHQVQPEFLDAAFDAVAQDHGDLETYFRAGLGLGDAEQTRLRELLLA